MIHFVYHLPIEQQAYNGVCLISTKAFRDGGNGPQ